MTRTLERLAIWFALAGGLALLAITLVTTLNAGAFLVDRITGPFGIVVEGLPGYEDFVRLTISAAALLFFPYCQLRRGHVAVDLLVNALPGGLRRALDRVWLALTACMAGFLGYWMALGLVETRADHTSSSILGWAEWPFYAPGIASLALWAVIAARQCLAVGQETGGKADAHGA